MRKLFLALAMVTLAGCYQSISLPPAPAGEFRAVRTQDAYRHDVVLFVNQTPATKARCALFSGTVNQYDLLVPLENGQIGLAYQPLVIFEVGRPSTVSGSYQRPGELALAGFRYGLGYSYLCVYNQALGGTVGLDFRTFRLEGGGLLGQQYWRPTYYGTQAVDLVNHVEYLYGPGGGLATNEFRLTFDAVGAALDAAEHLGRLVR